MTSQSHSTLWHNNSNTKNLTASPREWDRNRLEIYGSALEYNLISTCIKAKRWVFGSVYIKGNHMKLFQWNMAYFIAAYTKNINLHCWLKQWKWLQMTAFQKALYLYNALCTVCAGETMHCKPYYKRRQQWILLTYGKSESFSLEQCRHAECQHHKKSIDQSDFSLTSACIFDICVHYEHLWQNDHEISDVRYILLK